MHLATKAPARTAAPGVGLAAPKNRAWGFCGDSVRFAWEIDPQVVEDHLEKTTTDQKTASGVPYWPSRDPIGERGGLNLYGFVGNDGVNWWDYLGLTDEGKKKDVCYIYILVGHSTSTGGSNNNPDDLDASKIVESLSDIFDDHKQGGGGNRLPESDRAACVTCSRRNVNDSLRQQYPDQYIDNPDRKNGFSYPYPDKKGKEEIQNDPKGQTESVQQGFESELKQALKTAKEMCKCCKKVVILARGIDSAGSQWIASRLINNRGVTVDGKKYIPKAVGNNAYYSNKRLYRVHTHTCPDESESSSGK